MRRNADKMLKSRLTQEQYQNVKNVTIEEMAKEKVDCFISNFIAVFKPAMRDNKISDARADRIIEDICDKTYVRYKQGEKGQPREQDKYLSQEKIVGIASKVLKEYNIYEADKIAEKLYEAFMKEGKYGNEGLS
jgi:hypothetical protein